MAIANHEEGNERLDFSAIAVMIFRVFEPRAGSLQGLLPGAPTDPGVHVKCTRFVTLWNRCPSHDWVVSR